MDDIPITDDVAAPSRRHEPRSTQWLSESELRAKTDHDAVSFVEDCMLLGCGDLFEALNGLPAIAIVLSPRLYSFLVARSDIIRTGALKVDVQAGLFGKTETVHVPVYIQSPAPSDLRVSVVTYEALAKLKEADAVLNGLLAASAARVLMGGAQ